MRRDVGTNHGMLSPVCWYRGMRVAFVSLGLRVHTTGKKHVLAKIHSRQGAEYVTDRILLLAPRLGKVNLTSCPENDVASKQGQKQPTKTVY